MIGEHTEHVKVIDECAKERDAGADHGIGDRGRADLTPTWPSLATTGNIPTQSADFLDIESQHSRQVSAVSEVSYGFLEAEPSHSASSMQEPELLRGSEPLHFYASLTENQLPSVSETLSSFKSRGGTVSGDLPFVSRHSTMMSRRSSYRSEAGESEVADARGEGDLETPEEKMARKQVPLPSCRIGGTTACSEGFFLSAGAGPPNATLRHLMQHTRADWERARHLVSSLLDPEYSLGEFLADLFAFPELQLYLLHTQDEEGDATVKSTTTSSGRAACDEYQRTIGAFFAIFWLVRAEIDGKEGFSFGVDEDWTPLTKENVVEDEAKRLAFHEQGSWDYFRRLFADADLLRLDDDGKVVELNEARLLALLCLTAFHDIMKITALLPEVQPEHAPYHGYAAGDVIGDHDCALGYVMEHYPELLPSFSGLPPAERRAVLFTQSKIQFNHGWFVQAEAPPGAIFAKFREALQQRGPVDPRDMALYFAHWLTDLAGTEPTPLGGCEKFVTKFPVFVLNSFLRSFEFVKEAATKTETEVVEEYLKTRWVEDDPYGRAVPEGPDAIAKMRLLCMAQATASRVLQAFDALPEDDRQLLSLELGRSGCEGQYFSPTLVPPEAAEGARGPAILVYYGPAFLQNIGEDSARQRVCLLAEIFRRARALWPLDECHSTGFVTVYIDAIKVLGVDEIQKADEAGDVWLLVKRNQREAALDRQPPSCVEEMRREGICLQALDCSMDV